MPSITTTISLELEVTVSCSFDPPDPSVGIFEPTPQDFEVEFTSITPVLQMMKPQQQDFDLTRSTPKQMLLQAWNQLAPSLEQEIMDQTLDMLMDAHNEGGR